MKRIYIKCFMLLSVLAFAIACNKQDDGTALKNDLIKKTIGPNIVNDTIQFAYALAIPGGKLATASVEASVPGSKNTGLLPYSWYTNSGGNDVPVTVAKNCVTNGNISTAAYIDTSAATLRYYYVIPEAARGQSVSFKFSGTASNGETVSSATPEYKISKMDKQRNIVLTSGGACFISIKQMKAFTLAEVTANNLAGEIDLIYYYSLTTGIGHALVSPATSPEYLYGTVIPAGGTNNTKVSKRRDVKDAQLGSVYAEFIDDLDFETLNISNDEQNFTLDLIATNGAFLQTGDKKYKAFVLINSVDKPNKRMTVSIKRYTVN